MNRKIKWLGETKCNMCEQRGVSDPTIKGKKLYDAPTVYGYWATMCRNCFNDYSTKSMGQEYTRNEDDIFIKTKDIAKKSTKKSVNDFDAMLMAAFGF